MVLTPQKQSDHIRGVFSSQDIRKVGTGTTTRKTVQKVFWFVEQEDDGNVFVQPLNNNYVPTGSKRTITMDELLERYSPEPEFYVQSVFPKMQEMEQAVVKGDECRGKGETFSAEYEYSTALKLDEENVRANFGIGLTYLNRGEVDKADNIFERLVKLEAAFEEEHKHLFNDFGINLRKNKMYAQSVEYYSRGLELTQQDDNLHVNMARALLELQNYDACITHLLEALSLNEENDTAIKFLQWMDKKKVIPPARAQEVNTLFAEIAERSEPLPLAAEANMASEDHASEAEATSSTETTSSTEESSSTETANNANEDLELA